MQIITSGKAKISKVLGVNRPEGQVTITLANWLTIIRIGIVPIFWYAFYSDKIALQVSATLLFSIGAITDLFDGKIARKRGETTPFGIFMDPLADKILVLTAFWLILMREHFGVFYYIVLTTVLLISLREIGMTVLRFTSARIGKSVITSIWGKIKTGVHLTVLILLMLVFNVRDYFFLGPNQSWFGSDTFFLLFSILFSICAFASIISGFLYLRGLSLVSRK